MAVLTARAPSLVSPRTANPTGIALKRRLPIAAFQYQTSKRRCRFRLKSRYGYKVHSRYCCQSPRGHFFGTIRNSGLDT